ncbi:hypothetical protein RhiJN_08385 [Ceratobasidium sp. AG-Ba]|nr:hypothetical protein RhiJN_08385 [Ceratobasidium sp. AG-Ba]QRW09168.1 hypothetical protein RhiLY_08167 [Ceratobasidium sp. AG-Ba]
MASPYNGYSAAVQHWTSAHTHLTRAIEEYADASSALEIALKILPDRQPSSRSSLNRALDELEDQFALLMLDEKALQKTRHKLALLRNESRVLASINVNALPREVLGLIFHLACPPCHSPEDGAVKPEVISSVCTMWRNLSFSMPLLWSHIHINIIKSSVSDNQYLRLKSWVDRTQSSGLYIHITECGRGRARTEEYFSKRRYLQLATFLQPIMPRVYGLEIVSRCGLEDYINDLIDLWVTYGTLHTAKILSVDHTHCDGSLLIKPLSQEPEEGYGLASMLAFQSFFESLHTLRLHEILVPLNANIHRGLVELHLYNCLSDYILDQSTMLEILTACPELRSLKLVGINIIKSHEPNLEPVALNQLEVFTLDAGEVVQDGDTTHILPLIAGGSSSLSVAFMVEIRHLTPEFISIIHLFLARSNVKTLHIRGRFGYTIPLTPALTRIPQLQRLAFDYCDVSSDDALANFISLNTNKSGETLDPWPQLQELYLIDYNGTDTDMQRLISLHSIQTLRFYWHEEEGSKLSPELMQTLQRTVVNVTFYELDTDNNPTDSWDAAFPVLICDYDEE